MRVCANHRFCFFHQCVQKLHAETALTANDFQRFRLIIGEVFLLLCQMRIGLIELDSCKLDFFLYHTAETIARKAAFPENTDSYKHKK